MKGDRFGPILALTVAIAAVAAALTACGGSTSAAATGLTHAQLLRQGDAICVKAGRRIAVGVAQEVKKSGGKGLDQAAQEKILATITGPGIERMAAELGDLRPPANEADAMSAVVIAFERAGRRLQEKPKEGTRKNLLAPPARKAEKFGFESCSQF